MYTVLKTSGLDYVAVMPPHIAGQSEVETKSFIPNSFNFGLGSILLFVLLSHVFCLCLGPL